MPLSSIVGHAHLIALLRTAVANERVPQSLLFAGPEGVGKRTTAIALAQAINCQAQGPRPKAEGPRPKANGKATGQAGQRASARERVGGPGATPPENNDACGKCATCLRIARGQHTDVTVIDRGDNASIKIGDIRDRVMAVIGYRPFEARRRVIIIDGAEDMTVDAQNSLLKTLEEPPASAIIILISAYADTLLATIQSRCRRLRFGLLTDQEVARVLMETPDLKVPGTSGKVPGAIDAGRARLMASGAGGSVSRALAEETGDLSDDRDAAVALLQAASAKPVLPRLQAAGEFAKHDSKRRDREALAARLSLVASLCRDLTAMHAGAADAVANNDLEPTLRALTRAFPPDRLSRAFDIVEQAQQALERNAGAKIVADWVGASI